MKKITIFTLLLIFTFATTSFAQDAPGKPTEPEKPDFLKDRLFIDVFHSFWIDAPKTATAKKFNPGFNIGMVFDFKQNKKAPFSFGLGVGFTYHTQYSDALFKKGNDDVLRYYNLPDSSFHHKMNYFSCNIPLEFRYRHQKSGFKATLGVRIGLVAEISERYKGCNIDDPSAADWNFKNYNLPNKMKYHFDVYARIGWKYFSVYYSYQLTPVFQEGLGPKMAPMSIGFTYTLF
ncbi:hypothetical protein LJC68_06045 [Bacteroidales bacterium OttesenSCG-928-B11]|nr:hypothetical protein [Bacteroidales bacterium OttesenSCG-928-E04]MDL2312420.1 hypothetical protein [Bacteroidales bacterium OttesenSCG-928-B11]MDL2326323.1 hypothetical protein [Bacteroidales bacterium OttesenSCG-928-A14]